MIELRVMILKDLYQCRNNKNAIEAILYLMIIASNLMQLFMDRRLKSFVKSQKEVIMLMIKELYLLKELKCFIL